MQVRTCKFQNIIRKLIVSSKYCAEKIVNVIYQHFSVSLLYDTVMCTLSYYGTGSVLGYMHQVQMDFCENFEP